MGKMNWKFFSVGHIIKINKLCYDYFKRRLIIMMSKTHITIGTTCALLTTLANPIPTNACLALAGGALGGVMPDVDVIKNDRTGDALQGEIIAVAITVMSLIIDKIFGFNAFQLVEIDKPLFGLVILVALYILGISRDHRGFTHSLLALIIYSIPIIVIYKPLTEYYMIGYLSHLFIDLFNKRGIQLFFPLESRFCFGMCYADKLGNNMIMIMGFIATIILLFNCFILHIIL